MNGAHAELFTYTLYHDRLLPIDAEHGFTPLTLIKPYYEALGTEVEPRVRFRWQHAGHCFTFELEWKGEEFLMYILSKALDELPTVATWLVEKAEFKEHGHRLVKRAPHADVLKAIDVLRQSLDAFAGEDR